MDERKTHVVVVDGDNVYFGLKDRQLSPRLHIGCTTRFLKSLFSGRREHTRQLYFQTSDDESVFRLQRIMWEQSGWIVVTAPGSDGTDPATGLTVRRGLPDETIIKTTMAHIHPGTTRTLVVVSGDHAFIPLVLWAKRQGVKVIVVAFRGNASERLLKAANRAVYLDDYLERILLKEVKRRRREKRRSVE